VLGLVFTIILPLGVSASTISKDSFHLNFLKVSMNLRWLATILEECVPKLEGVALAKQGVLVDIQSSYLRNTT
jgi:hypothetical protein